MSDWNTQVIEEFRANGGKVGGNFEGAPVLLLGTTGARSGKHRVHPMMYLADEANGAHGDRLIVFASKAGAPTNPDWYRNLVAHPVVTVEVGTETYDAVATPVAGAERDALYAEQARRYPGFAEYEQRTDRVIPVVALVRK
jgi:deazaflavin-dependent oxidoreductase (nitroreductase family)